MNECINNYQQVQMSPNGITCHLKDTILHLDPKKAVRDRINFVSHAHKDHLPSKSEGTVLSSNETILLANLRGFIINNHVEKLDNIHLVDSGHILGSKGLIVEDIFYTGDICTRDRGFLKGAKIPKCKTLITECTFGLPEFTFPSIEETSYQVNQMISDLYSKGIPVILMGYELGKAQTLSYLFSHWDPIYYHDSVKVMNDLHRKLGVVDIKDAMSHTEAEKNGMLTRKPWIMISPMMSKKNSFIRDMKSKYGAVTIGFSGWNASSRFSSIRNGADASFPLSDHCDFNDLIKLVIDSEAEKIYTIHGFVKEFAEHLKKLGFDAEPLL